MNNNKVHCLLLMTFPNKIKVCKIIVSAVIFLLICISALCFSLGLIEKRGGAPLLDMLPDVFEWPIAVDNWEINNSKSLFSTVILSRVMYRKFALCQIPFLLSSSGKSWRLEDVIAKLNEKYGTQLLVNFFVSTDDKDSTSYIIHVGVQL